MNKTLIEEKLKHIDSRIAVALKEQWQHLDPEKIQCTLTSIRYDVAVIRCELKESGWQPIETAPKDGSEISVWHDHDSDPYYMRGNYKLTSYGAWCEGLGFEIKAGQYVAVYGGGYHDNPHEGPEERMPDGWFKQSDNGFESPLAPTHWKPLDKPPEVKK